MAMVISNDPDLFNGLAHGEQTVGTLDYIADNLRDLSNLKHVSDKLLDRGLSIYREVTESSTMDKVRHFKNNVLNLWKSDEIKPCSSLDDFRNAGSKMRRWIMAEPEVKRRYEEQTIEGYDSLYESPYKGKFGEDDYDYRRVMNGILYETEDGKMQADTYFEDLEHGDRELTFSEQTDILISWTEVKNILNEGKEDPTSVWGAFL